MTILILNWRSFKDPLAGGAELATFEHARRWVKKHDVKVIWLSPKYKESPKREKKDGIEFIHIGIPINRDSIFNVLFTLPFFYFLVFFNYLFKYRGKIDIVIDQVHGIPYLTPLYVREKVVVYIHEVAGDIWNKMYPFPFNKLGLLVEKIFFLFYKSSQFVAVSKGTKKDLKSFGIKKIDVIYNGVSTKVADKVSKKESIFTVVFLNRLVKMKGIERALKVFAEVNKQLSQSQFWVIGRGESSYVNRLNKLSSDLGIQENIVFYGFVNEEQKVRLLSKAHILLNTSYKEGWGLVNIEANSRGTPVVAFDVEGNNESVISGKNGYIVRDDDLEGMVKSILKVKREGKVLQKSSLNFSKQFDWDKQSERFYKLLANS